MEGVGVAEISVVIPAFNAAATIVATLQNVLAAEPAVAEVIVVDDGSTDGTRQLAAQIAESDARVQVIHIGRDERACRSRARNRGAAQARGEFIFFLDSAWRLEPGLLRAAAALLRNDAVLLVPFGRGDASDDVAAEGPDLIDDRWGYFVASAGNIAKLACPWLLGWTGAMFVTRQLFEHVGGFDESFVDWGAEDLEFSLRLHRAGARFHGLLSHCAFRAHGPAAEGPERMQQLARNIARIQQKHPCLETELLNAMGQTHASAFLERLELLPLQRVVTAPDPEAVSVLRKFVGGSVDLINGATLAYAAALGAPCLLSHNASSVRELHRYFPERRILRTIGAVLPFRDRELGVAVATDIVRVLPPPAQLIVLRELVRVARRAVLMVTARADPAAGDGALWRAVAAFELCPIQELLVIVRKAGLRATPAHSSSSTLVVEIERGPAA